MIEKPKRKIDDDVLEELSKRRPELVEMKNKMSRRSLAKAAADIFVRGLRNDRRILREIIRRGPDEFCRLAKSHYGGYGFRQSDLRYIYSRLVKAAMLLDAEALPGVADTVVH